MPDLTTTALRGSIMANLTLDRKAARAKARDSASREYHYCLAMLCRARVRLILS